MDICQAIIECIENPESGVSTAITNLIGGALETQSREIGQSWNNTDMASSVNPECDLDILFGQCIQLVEYIDVLNTEFFAILEVATNELDFLADVIGDITLVDETSIDAAISFIQYAQENIAENYEAQSTLEYKETLACDIFCVARFLDCAITPTILYNVMKSRLSSSLDIVALWDEVLDFLVDGEWTGSQIADFMFYAQFATRAMIGRYFDNLAWSDIQSRLVIYGNDPNGDWTTLCDCPVPPDYSFDFTTSDEDWDIVDQTGQPASGVYVAAEGYDQNYASGRWRVQIWFDIGSTVDIDKIEVDVNWVQSGVTNVVQIYQNATIEGVVTQIATSNVSSNGEQTFTFDNNYSSNQFVINSANGTLNQVGTKGTQVIKAVRVWLQ